MTRYKYYIKQNRGKYYFGLYPNNNWQSIGVSGEYDNEELAKEGLKNFQLLVKSAADVYELFDTAEESYGNVVKYIFVLKANKHRITFYRKRAYDKRGEVKKGIERIKKNIDAPLKYQ